jgi:hypothetical protein
MSKGNRAFETKRDSADVKVSVTLFDIDYAMMSYLEETVLPNVDDGGGGASIRIPVIYGNSERWNTARRDGVYRDSKGKVQLPIAMIRRTSIAKDENIPILKRHVTYPAITKYSKDNRYDRFSVLGKSFKPKYDVYNITMPQYVEVSYECMVWTNFIEHLNAVIEQVNFSSAYWGSKDKYKFHTTISDYTVVNEVGDGNQRINRVEFNLSVKAYLLPESFDGERSVKKSQSIKRVVVSTEVDATGYGRLEGLLTTPSPYYDNKDLVDFLALNGSVGGYPVQENTITFTNIKPVKTPLQLKSVITGGIEIGDDIYDIRVYVNGVRYNFPTEFTAVLNSPTSLTINFDPVALGFTVDTDDEVVLTGKFIEL